MKKLALPRGLGVVLGILAVSLVGTSCGKSRGSGPVPGLPEITDVSPDSGAVSGGLPVLISTANFQDDFNADLPEVFFGGDAAAVTPVDGSSVTAVTPAHGVPEAVAVEVRSTGVVETATLVAGFTYTSVSCTISSIAPDRGSTFGGTTVTIDGAGFDEPPLPLPVVEFGAGNLATRVVSLGMGLLEADSPPRGSPGLVDVIVTVQAGTCTLPAGFEYVPPGPCTIGGASPAQGYRDAPTTVYVDGTNFDVPPLPAPTVEFGPGAFGRNVVVIDQDRLILDTPVVPAPGPVDVIVTNQSDQCTLPGGFEFLEPPPPATGCFVGSIDPTFGPDFGQSRIRILGTGFLWDSRVWIGTQEATSVTFAGETELWAEAPPGIPGLVDITVDTGGGVTCVLPGAYEYISCGGGCNLQGVVPNTGGAGDPVVLNGSGFEAGALVFFGNAPDWSEAAVTDDSGAPASLVVMVPARAGSSSTVDVMVVNPSGSCCTRNNAFTYVGCIIESVLPTIGTEEGGQNFLIQGRDLPTGPTVEVWFGSEKCDIVIARDPYQVFGQTPPGNGQRVVDVLVLDPATGDSCLIPEAYAYHGCVIDSVVPDSGGTNGGYEVRIIGSGYETNPLHLKVMFDANYVHPDLLDVDLTGNVITVSAPPSATGGPKDVWVFNEMLYRICVSPGAFTYILPGSASCTVTRIDPPSGSAMGGEIVTIEGSGFDDRTGVLFGPVPSPRVDFISPFELQVETPPWVQPGPIGGGGGPSNVVVAPQNSDPCFGTFQFVPPSCPGACTVTNLVASTGPVAGGNLVWVNGSGFCKNGPQIIFGTELATQVTFIDESSIAVEVPPSVTGAGPVDVIYTDGGNCMTFCPGCYTYN